MEQTIGNTQAVQKFFASLEAHDKDASLATFDENGYWDTPSGGPYSGRFVGRAGVGRLIQFLVQSRPETAVVSGLTLHAEGDRVFAEFTWAPLAGTAARAPTRSLAVFELSFGKITAVREFESGPPARTG